MGNHFYPIIIYEYCLWNGGWKLFQLWEMWEGFCLVFISAGDNNTKNFHNTIIFRWIFIFKLSPLINNIMSALLPNIRQRCMCAFCLLVYLHSKETLEFPNFVCYSTISLNFEQNIKIIYKKCIPILKILVATNHHCFSFVVIPHALSCLFDSFWSLKSLNEKSGIGTRNVPSM